MHNLKTNFDKIFDITKSFFNGSINADYNFYNYPRKPKMSDCEIITLSILGESIGIDSENYLFGKLKSDHFEDFPNLIEKSGEIDPGNPEESNPEIICYITCFFTVTFCDK